MAIILGMKPYSNSYSAKQIQQNTNDSLDLYLTPDNPKPLPMTAQAINPNPIQENTRQKRSLFKTSIPKM